MDALLCPYTPWETLMQGTVQLAPMPPTARQAADALMQLMEAQHRRRSTRGTRRSKAERRASQNWWK